MSLEIIKTGNWQILWWPMKHGARKEWFKDNIGKIMYLDYVIVEQTNDSGKISFHKVILKKFKDQHQEENNYF